MNASSCILPRTTKEFEKSSELGKIKAIRGLTPKKDIQISVSNKSNSVSYLFLSLLFL